MKPLPISRVSVLAAAALLAEFGLGSFRSHADDAVTYRSNAAHTAQANMPTFTSQPQRLWIHTFDGPVSYALIANDSVYVFVSSSENGEAQATGLYALDAATGRKIWGPIKVPVAFGGMAYDNHRIFIAGAGYSQIEAFLLAYSDDQGQLLYSTALYGQFPSQCAPTPFGGVIYASGYGIPNAVRESDGDIQWFSDGTEVGSGSIAGSSAGIFISSGAGSTYSLNPANGSLLWSTRSGAVGGGGFTCASYGSHVFVRDFYSPTNADAGVEMDASTGHVDETYPDTSPQAFDDNMMFAVTSSGSLTATRLSDFSTAWSFTDAINKPVTAPTIVNGIVYVGTSMGHLLGYDEVTGKKEVSVLLGEQPSPTVESTTDMSAGDGIVAVPCGDSLVAVGNRPVPAQL